jgi:hypothetical protein
MRYDGRHPSSSSAAPFAVPDLHVCRGCRWTFVVPVAMVDVLGPDRYLVELQCNNCGLTVVEPHDEQVLEALDRELDRQAADMRAALEVWEVTRQAEEIDAFARALHDGHILPEDF